MTIERTLQKLQQLLDAGDVAKAVATIATGHADLSKEPRELLPVLNELDRQRNAAVLQPILEKLQELNLLPLESAIFDLRIRFRASDHVGALRTVENILTVSGGHIEALRTGGRIGNLMKDDSVALRYWERLARTAPSDPEAALQAARIHFRRKQFAQALDWARQAANGRADATEALQIAVSAALETGWTEGCDPLLARLFAADKTRALPALTQLAQDLDCESVARFIGSLPPQFRSDQAVADMVSKAYSGWLVAGLEQELASRELDAAAYYRAARTVRPAEANAQRALDRLSLPSLMAMREAFNGREFAGAIEHGIMATRINPDSFEAWQTVGRAQFTLGNIAEAGSAFRRCTELNGKDAPSWLTLGLVLNQAGDRRDALAAFQNARGLANSEVKREAEASIAGLYPLLVADAQQAVSRGDFDLGWAYSESVLKIRPTDPEILELRRNLLRQQREQIRQAWNSGSDSAVGLCRLYLQKSPNDSYASTVLGRTLMRMRSYTDALPIWEGLSRLAPEDSHNHLQVARCCRLLKIKEKGLSAAEAALRLDPNLREAAEIAETLRAWPSSGARLGQPQR
ncbi:MAG: hypothetical protein B7Y08_11510 [Rhodospirillales bacterium 24-66-33]|jgi:tetratricopeptide (TPR) repeat protein|uniref:hypothetical protein n=1 Tax=Reyranella sp. TaxID=1929291 RepID=UPI000BDD2F8D|nr:hypothetical protein [Reyranella sp.]OYY43668.1 MAG: hypothetical protein B7Y57_08625 [Rhodospirillales bacterium 35-66-84]OYZ94496.1 MAG: hypothetical protein B7Y08_11510 [Rhodospirillales bacterium 24-66-33]OZB25608.1 MAG: hypothetical protein B7X63_12085 [Rhodospirillales bacterium 39-66-50]HQS16776.1 hypothetical protein [Reyranella sp.]HQT13476.1 hypothetical protein [Reyranella sp.]